MTEPAFMPYTIGDFTVTKIPEREIEFAPPSALFEDWNQQSIHGRESALAMTLPDDREMALPTSIHSWLIKGEKQVILVDTGIGNGKTRALPYFNDLNTDYLKHLADAGVAPGDVSHVLLTHIHTDHVGWNTVLRDGKWAPTFPNATYIIPQAGHDYFSSAEGRAKPNYGMYEDSVLPIIQAHQAQMIGPSGGEILPGIVYYPTPGHSVDHVSISLSASGQCALFAGDIMHHPIQVYEEGWNSRFCANPALARQSRRRVIERCAETGALYLSSHFSSTSAGFISRIDNGFSWRFA
jgi:glyoxylase-like metal-dependent hydrolase (beta-lactamase superfamily II)